MADKQTLESLLAGDTPPPAIRRGRGVQLSTDAEPSPPIEPSPPAAPPPLRVNRGYMLREDLVTRCKVLAAVERRKLYEVMEAALEAYLDQHGA